MVGALPRLTFARPAADPAASFQIVSHHSCHDTTLAQMCRPQPPDSGFPIPPTLPHGKGGKAPFPRHSRYNKRPKTGRHRNTPPPTAHAGLAVGFIVWQNGSSRVIAGPACRLPAKLFRDVAFSVASLAKVMLFTLTRPRSHLGHVNSGISLLAFFAEHTNHLAPLTITEHRSSQVAFAVTLLSSKQSQSSALFYPATLHRVSDCYHPESED
jgi:hypothetical protein